MVVVNLMGVFQVFLKHAPIFIIEKNDGVLHDWLSACGDLFKQLFKKFSFSLLFIF